MLERRANPDPTSGPKANGKIINITSLNAMQGGLNIVAYAASKHAVQGIVSPPLEYNAKLSLNR